MSLADVWRWLGLGGAFELELMGVYTLLDPAVPLDIEEDSR